MARTSNIFLLYEKEPWNSKGMCIIPVGNYLVFYT